MSDKDLRKSVTATHPGEILKDILLGHGMSQKELAAAIGKTTPVVNDILSKKRDINVEIAVLLEAIFEETPATFWIDLQSKFDLELARLSKKVQDLERGIREWKSLGEYISLRTVKKRAGIGESVISDLAYLCTLYNVDTVDNLKVSLANTFRSAYFKKSEVLQTDQKYLISWILLTRISNDHQKLSVPFSLNRIKDLINQLNDIFYLNKNTIENVKAVLNEYGIRFFIEKKLDKVPVDGYSFWRGDNPTIVVTTRYSWLDNLAFTIFHELGHIVKHLFHDKTQDFLDMIEPGNEEKNEESEKEANEFASECLRRGCDLNSVFRRIINPFSSTATLQRISQNYGINEGILVGQYQFFCKTILNHPSAFAIGAKLRQKIK